jgi:tol-pal system protein YbgF
MLAENPGGRLAPNARYWLGECYYAQGRFREAADEFQRCADDYPQTDKAADSLLKLSFSYDRLGDGPRAMSALDRLLGQYPKSNAAGLIRSGRGHF